MCALVCCLTNNGQPLLQPILFRVWAEWRGSIVVGHFVCHKIQSQRLGANTARSKVGSGCELKTAARGCPASFSVGAGGARRSACAGVANPNALVGKGGRLQRPARAERRALPSHFMRTDSVNQMASGHSLLAIVLVPMSCVLYSLASVLHPSATRPGVSPRVADLVRQIFNDPVGAGGLQFVRRRAMLPDGVAQRPGHVRLQGRLREQAGEKARQ